jgi:hypothetical protein
MTKEKILKAALTFILIFTVTSAPIMLLAHADTPAEPHAGDAMWTEPSTISVTGANAVVGYKFNVTVWINLTESSAAWEFVLAYNNSQLNATRAGYTAGGKSDFFSSILTYALPPTFGVYNATHSSVLCGETWNSGPYRDPGYGSLEWVEFQVMSAPPAGQTYTSMIALTDVYPGGSADTYAQDPSMNKIAVTPFATTYSITTPGGAPSTKNTLNVTTTVGGSTNATGAVQYNAGTIVYVLASANPGYVFGNWLVNATNVGSVNPIQMKMNASYNVQAVFTPAFTLNVTSTVGGSTNATGVSQYATGAVVYVLATAGSGYVFTNWVVNGTNVGSVNPIQMKMNASYNVQAIFTSTGPPSANKYDLNGDGSVGVDDVLIAIQAFGSKPGDSRWNSKADINGDGMVRVDDIFAICLHFGR